MVENWSCAYLLAFYELEGHHVGTGLRATQSGKAASCVSPRASARVRVLPLFSCYSVDLMAMQDKSASVTLMGVWWFGSGNQEVSPVLHLVKACWKSRETLESTQFSRQTF